MALESAMKTLMLLSPGWLGQHVMGNERLVIRLTDARSCNIAYDWTVTINAEQTHDQEVCGIEVLCTSCRQVKQAQRTQSTQLLWPDSFRLSEWKACKYDLVHTLSSEVVQT